MDRFLRTQALLGKDGIDKLSKSCIALFGLGGVGGQVLETLARCAVGKFILIDYDTINETNLNRQVIATEGNIGALKTHAAAERLKSINSEAEVHVFENKIMSVEDLGFLDDFRIDYIVDAIDGFEGKISIILYASAKKIPVISSMGTGNRLDPTKFKVADISKTEMCPLARKVRQRLRKEGILKLKTVYSPETPLKHDEKYIGSVSFVPPAAGILIASEVIKDIIDIKKTGGRHDK